MTISGGFVSSKKNKKKKQKKKKNDKHDDFDFHSVNFPFLDGDVPRATSYGIYISQLIWFARVPSHVTDFNITNKILTAKLLKQGYRYHKFRKTYSKFYRRHDDMVSQFNTALKSILKQGQSEPELYDLAYKFRKNVGRNDFSDHFKSIIIRYKRIGYKMNFMRQTASLVVDPITVNNLAEIFNCTPAGRASALMMAPA